MRKCDDLFLAIPDDNDVFAGFCDQLFGSGNPEPCVFLFETFEEIFHRSFFFCGLLFVFGFPSPAPSKAAKLGGWRDVGFSRGPPVIAPSASGLERRREKRTKGGRGNGSKISPRRKSTSPEVEPLAGGVWGGSHRPAIAIVLAVATPRGILLCLGRGKPRAHFWNGSSKANASVSVRVLTNKTHFTGMQFLSINR